VKNKLLMYHTVKLGLCGFSE